MRSGTCTTLKICINNGSTQQKASLPPSPASARWSATTLPSRALVRLSTPAKLS
jgi:hypothetical protein